MVVFKERRVTLSIMGQSWLFFKGSDSKEWLNDRAPTTLRSSQNNQRILPLPFHTCERVYIHFCAFVRLQSCVCFSEYALAECVKTLTHVNIRT